MDNFCLERCRELKAKGAIYAIVVCDTFDWEDYVVGVMPGDKLSEIKSEYDGKNMQKIMEIIDFSNWDKEKDNLPAK